MAKRIARLFPWFGGKARLAPKLPAPEYDTIIEPFCGSACYSLLHGADREVILRDSDERLVSMLQWLVGVSEDEFLALPTYGQYRHTDDVADAFGAPAAFYVKLWNSTSGSTSNSWPPPSTLADAEKSPTSLWTEQGKLRLARALPLIRHWTVECGPYYKARNRKATWFIDPPYQGKYDVEYLDGTPDAAHLADWVHSRKGEVIVTERTPADWLPFVPFNTVAGSQGHAGSRGAEKGKQQDVVYWALNS